MKREKEEKPPKGTWKNILKTIFSCCPFSAAFYIFWVILCAAASFLILFTLERLVAEVMGFSSGTASLQLMRKKGKYRAMYEMQSGWYR